MGACSGFLTESIDGLLDDAHLLRPTSLVVVPRVLSPWRTCNVEVTDTPGGVRTQITQSEIFGLRVTVSRLTSTRCFCTLGYLFPTANLAKLKLFTVGKLVSSNRLFPFDPSGKFHHRSVVDTMLFGKLRKKFGGRVCCIISGSAPLSPELSKFAHAVFNLVFEGYGTTETMGGVTLSPIGEYRLGTVGGVVYGVELKLVDVPDLDLVALRDGRGEVRF
ncbi:unnamed protein product [Schistosoma mattheei]|uniref:long-chain-fatty-acid--CoA ligase n=1 Tax=Schistosoma mattheei TaxID=31246 RepID=A0A183PYU5_9TREM|nr:unnamed protein product [Schistosoma mattheei]